MADGIGFTDAELAKMLGGGDADVSILEERTGARTAPILCDHVTPGCGRTSAQAPVWTPDTSCTIQGWACSLHLGWWFQFARQGYP